MLLNIPILILYSWLTIILLNTVRITFTNNLESEITDIRIIGCGGGKIENLQAGEKTTVWVSIEGDCSITLDYLLNGQRKSESVLSYTTPNNGSQFEHKIDGRDKENGHILN